jgi:hypothetical protein
METLLIVGQEFIFAGLCLRSRSLVTDIHATLFNFVKISDFLILKIERRSIIGLIQYLTKRKDNYLLISMFNVNKAAKWIYFCIKLTQNEIKGQLILMEVEK